MNCYPRFIETKPDLIIHFSILSTEHPKVDKIKTWLESNIASIKKLFGTEVEEDKSLDCYLTSISASSENVSFGQNEENDVKEALIDRK